MLRLKKIKVLIASGLVIIFAFVIIPLGAVNGQADPFMEVKEKLTGISEEEKEILINLFTIMQEIELIEAEEKELTQGVEAISKEIGELEAAIAEEERTCVKKQEGLASVLRSYQRMGPGSFLEIILSSDSLSTFLHRINTIRDLTKNTGELLEQLESSKEKLEEGKTELSEKLSLFKDKQEQSRQALARNIKLKNEKEEYLTSLKGEREYYQEHLDNIQEVWNELKLLISEAAKEFSYIIEKESLPTEALKLTFSFFEVKGSIEDEIINKVISEHSKLPSMTFAFHPDKVEISLPEKNIVLLGTFIILEGNTLKFQAQEGSFYGMPLEPGSMEELFSEGDLVLNLEPLLAGNKINAIAIKEGYLELISKLKLF
jgi:peptidoglycan hydrolase CwlO-like protein